MQVCVSLALRRGIHTHSTLGQSIRQDCFCPLSPLIWSFASPQAVVSVFTLADAQPGSCQVSFPRKDNPPLSTACRQASKYRQINPEEFIQRFFSNLLLSNYSVLDLKPWCLDDLLPHNNGSPSSKPSFPQTLWKCCTQHHSKLGKLSSGHRTGKGQFSFQPQRKAMPKNVQATGKLHSSHTLAK